MPPVAWMRPMHDAAIIQDFDRTAELLRFLDGVVRGASHTIVVKLKRDRRTHNGALVNILMIAE